MDLKAITLALIQKAMALENHAPGAEWFLFGSITRGVRLPNDLDLLIIYKNDSDAGALRQGLESFAQSLPLHLLLLRRDEEKELEFVKGQKAMRIFPK